MVAGFSFETCSDHSVSAADLSSCVRHVARQWRSDDVPDYMVPRPNRGRGSTALESATEAAYFRKDRTRRTQTPKSAALAISPSTRCMTESVTMAEISSSAETAPKTTTGMRGCRILRTPSSECTTSAGPM